MYDFIYIINTIIYKFIFVLYKTNNTKTFIIKKCIILYESRSQSVKYFFELKDSEFFLLSDILWPKPSKSHF